MFLAFTEPGTIHSHTSPNTLFYRPFDLITSHYPTPYLPNRKDPLFDPFSSRNRPIRMPNQTITRTIESTLEPTAIFTTLSKPELIPHWAPVFADSTEHISGGNYHFTKGTDTFAVEVITNNTSLTVDILREMPNNIRGGAYIRVMPRPLGGSTVVMTIPLGPTAVPENVSKVLEQELEALINLV
jgi:hypothetical protein